jgi:hypothetical protein
MQHKPFPTLLNKTDAMMFAADVLDEMSSKLRLIKVFSDTVAKKAEPSSTDPEYRKALDELKIAAGQLRIPA